MKKVYMGLEIGGTKLLAVRGTGEGRILARRRLEVAKGAEGIRQQITGAFHELFRKDRPAVAGAGFGGPVDRRKGTVLRSYHIRGWDGFGLRNWLEDLVQAPAALDNDANTAALGEALRGAGRGRDPVFYTTMGSGMGGGLVAGGEIYHGAAPGEMEIGHARAGRRGVIFESRCSGWAADRKIRRYARARPESLLAWLTRGVRGGESQFLLQALEQKDTGAQRIFNEMTDDLAFALSHVTQLLHPETIVLGGGLSRIGEPLRRAVEERLPGYIMDAFRPGPEIVLAALGEDAVPAGALLMAAEFDRNQA